MKQKMRRDVSAFTRIELAVVLVVVLVLASMLLPPMHKVKAKAPRIECVNNLKEIGTAYRLWCGDVHGEKFPATESLDRWGWKDLLTNADQGVNCWSNYAIIADYLTPATAGNATPKLLICPADERQPATDFITNGMRYEWLPHGVKRIDYDSNAPPLPAGRTYFKDNSTLSYFVGVSVNDVQPEGILSGDRNLGPGPLPDADYGYSPKSGKGNDVAVPISGPVSWSLKMHSAGNTSGSGNILLGDGSVQQVSSAGFRTNWLIHAGPTTNWPAGHVPSSPSIRLVFP
jgi:competence protein ComGC